jgi:hypothetical protein
MNEISVLEVRVPAEIIHNWGSFLVFGLGLMLLGILAIVRSVAATVVSMLFFGWLLVIAAGIEIVQFIMVGRWAGEFVHVLAAVLFGVVGILMVWRPVASAEMLTLLMGGVLPGGGPISADRTVLDRPARLGLARSQWDHHACPRCFGADAMAGLGPVGDRHVRGH